MHWQVILWSIQSWGTASREAGWCVRMLFKEHSPSRAVLSSWLLLPLCSRAEEGFSPLLLIVFVPDFPSDPRATGWKLWEVGFSSTEARTCKGLSLPVMERTAHLVTASISLEVLLMFVEHLHTVPHTVLCHTLYWAYTHCFLHLFVL